MYGSNAAFEQFKLDVCVDRSLNPHFDQEETTIQEYEVIDVAEFDMLLLSEMCDAA